MLFRSVIFLYAFLLNNAPHSDTVEAMRTQHHPLISALLSIFMSAILADVSYGQSNTNISPAVICNQSSYDFGEMDNRKTVEHTFTVKNLSSNPVEITKIFSG